MNKLISAFHNRVHPVFTVVRSFYQGAIESNQGGDFGNQTPIFAYNPLWVRFGAFWALTGYLSQIVCHFLFVAGLCITHPLGAMESTSHGDSYYTDKDIVVPINTTPDNSAEIECAVDYTCLPQLENQGDLMFCDRSGEVFAASQGQTLPSPEPLLSKVMTAMGVKEGRDDLSQFHDFQGESDRIAESITNFSVSTLPEIDRLNDGLVRAGQDNLPIEKNSMGVVILQKNEEIRDVNDEEQPIIVRENDFNSSSSQDESNLNLGKEVGHVLDSQLLCFTMISVGKADKPTEETLLFRPKEKDPAALSISDIRSTFETKDKIPIVNLKIKNITNLNSEDVKDKENLTFEKDKNGIEALSSDEEPTVIVEQKFGSTSSEDGSDLNLDKNVELTLNNQPLCSPTSTDKADKSSEETLLFRSNEKDLTAIDISDTHAVCNFAEEDEKDEVITPEDMPDVSLLNDNCESRDLLEKGIQFAPSLETLNTQGTSTETEDEISTENLKTENIANLNAEGVRDRESPILEKDKTDIEALSRDEEPTVIVEQKNSAMLPLKMGKTPNLNKEIKSVALENQRPCSVTKTKDINEKMPLFPSKVKNSNCTGSSDLNVRLNADVTNENIQGSSIYTLSDNDEQEDSWGGGVTLTLTPEQDEPTLPDNQHSWKESTPLQKKSLERGELASFSGKPNNPLPNSDDDRHSFSSRRLLINQSEPEELTDSFFFISRDYSDFSLEEPSDLSPEAKDFLHYVKKRVVGGEINWKQILGIGGGIITGAAVAWPWMCILSKSLLALYAYHVIASVDYTDSIGYIVDPAVFTASFHSFNKYVNFYTMLAMVGIPRGIDAASRTASILMDFAHDNIDSFSIRRSTKQSLALMSAKGGIYFGVFWAGLLPLYYFYDRILGCNHLERYFVDNSTKYRYTYGISADIFLNISTHINATDFENCTLKWHHLPSDNFLLFETTAPFLFLNTFLHYGHQLSRSTTKWVDSYFFTEKDESSSLEAIRQGYLTQFKNLKRIIYVVEESELDKLYDIIFAKKAKIPDNKPEISPEHVQNDTFRILKTFNKFHRQHQIMLENKEPETWKKVWASRIGWAIPLISTMGRTIIFEYALAHLLGTFLFDPDYTPNSDAWTLAYVFGFSLAHFSQAFIEKEAVEASVYDLLGGEKLAHGRSHAPLRNSLKVWDYMYGFFNTLPYVIIGLGAPNGFNFEFFNLRSFHKWNPGYIATRQILFLLTFGIADVFNNAVAFHCSNFNLVNAFDSALSYYYPFEGYKRDKLIRTARELRKVFKGLRPDVLQKVDQLNSLDKKRTNKMDELGGKVFNLSRQPSLVLNEEEYHESNHIYSIIADDAPLTLSPETQAFLQYVKIKIADGTLNWKQKAGIMGGIVTGASVAWPLMVIIFDGLLPPYMGYIYNYYCCIHKSLPDPSLLAAQFENFNKYLNFYSMMGVVGLPMAVDAASRTATILSDLTAENTCSFSIQKNKNHQIALLCAKGSIYFGAFTTGFLPVYYLYDSLFGCNNNIYILSYNPPLYNFTASADIFLNISVEINSPDFKNCTLQRDLLPLGNKLLFGIGSPFLFFDTFLQYGYLLSAYTMRKIDAYFLSEMRTSACLSPVEATRQGYLSQFKGLKRIIDELDEGALDDLYSNVFVQDAEREDQNIEISFEEQTQNEAIRILKAFNALHHQHKSLKEEEPEVWKKTWASNIGWAIPLLATFGRTVIFQYAIEELFKTLSFEGTGISIFSGCLGGIFANVSQGLIEKEAVEEGIYDLLRGKKIPHGNSHTTLRTGLKIWDYIYGVIQTLPYLVAGYYATVVGTGPVSYDDFTSIQPWQILFLINFGLADAFNNAIAFHDSNFNVVNAFDSTMSYWEPSEEYKRDKLIRMTRQLRNLFKEIRPDVLQTVDQLLSEDLDKHQQQGTNTNSLFADDEDDEGA